MAELKTKENDASVEEFLNTIENEQKKKDCLDIVKLMTEATKMPAKMWGGAIIGFGSYHYKYDSGHEGEMCKVGFSPRKSSITMYIGASAERYNDVLPKLGKHKLSGSCLHLNKLADVDKEVLKKIIKGTYDQMTKTHG